MLRKSQDNLVCHEHSKFTGYFIKIYKNLYHLCTVKIHNNAMQNILRIEMTKCSRSNLSQSPVMIADSYGILLSQ